MKSRQDILYVGIQFVLFALFAFNLRFIDLLPKASVMLFGGAVLTAVGGIMVILSMLHLSESLSPFPTPKKHAEHKQVGFYKYVRHPIYTGIILGAFGLSLWTSSEWRLIIAIALYLLFQSKARYEETLLKAKYPTYQRYIESTGRFFPRLFN